MTESTSLGTEIIQRKEPSFVNKMRSQRRPGGGCGRKRCTQQCSVANSTETKILPSQKRNKWKYNNVIMRNNDRVTRIGKDWDLRMAEMAVPMSRRGWRAIVKGAP